MISGKQETILIIATKKKEPNKTVTVKFEKKKKTSLWFIYILYQMHLKQSLKTLLRRIIS